MSISRIIGAVAGGVLFAVAGVAVAANITSSHQTDFFAPGTHQFYVWCAGGHSYHTTETGASAEDAQMKLYAAVKKAGHSTCWPIWQGRLSG